MKRSEILRTAANTKLWDGIEGTRTTDCSEYICLAAAAVEFNRRLETYIENAIPGPSQTTFSLAMRATYPTEIFSKEEIQAMRFMFAHFLAHALEDEGL